MLGVLTCAPLKELPSCWHRLDVHRSTQSSARVPELVHMTSEDEIVRYSNSSWTDKVERRETIPLDACQTDEMVASLGQCLTAVYAVNDAVETDDCGGFKRKHLAQASRSIEEAATFLDTLTANLTT